MSSPTSEKQETPEVTPRQTMRGHTQFVRGAEHLPGGRHIITCSLDGSLRLWDLKSNAQVGDDWRDEGDEAAVYTIALSRNGNTVASGSADGTVRLWVVETGKIIAKWTGHTDWVLSVCWSTDGERVMSGSYDGTVRVWDVKSGKTVLGPIETGGVHVVMYSPDTSKIATGGRDKGIKIWDGKTCKLITTLKHNHQVWSLAWTSDGKKLISGSFGPIRIFDTATWEEIAILKGHTRIVRAISLSSDERLLASASRDSTAYLWNLDTNLPVEPFLQHRSVVECAAFSADGRVLVTGCYDGDVYVWDSHAILKEAGLEDLLPISDVAAGKSLMNSDATRRPAQIKIARQLPPTFFDDIRGDIHSSGVHGTHARSPANHRRNAHTPSGSPSPIVLLGRLSSLFRRSHPSTNEATELQQHPRRTIFSPHGPNVVRVAAVRDKKPLAVAPRPERERSHTQAAGTTTPGATAAQSRPVPWWAHVVLFLCCASPPPAKETQQQPQGQSQVQAQASSSQTQPAAASTSATPPAPATSTNMPSTATTQSRPLPLRARFVLFLCCVSSSHADGR